MVKFCSAMVKCGKASYCVAVVPEKSGLFKGYAPEEKEELRC